jgi:predicted amidohydrolase
MALISRYIAAGIQYTPQETEIGREATDRNLKRMKDYFDWTYEQYSYCGDASCSGSEWGAAVKLIAYPEYAANGYPAGSMAEALKASEEVPGPITDEIGKWAKEYDCFIAYGMGSTVPEFPKTSFDTSIIQDDNGEVVLRYHKTNPWLPDEYWPSPYDLVDSGWDLEKYPYFPVAETRIGNLGSYICNDGMTPEPCRQLAFNGAEFMYHPELLMDPWIIPPLEYFELQTRWNSVVNCCWHMAVNSGWTPAQMPPYGMQGGSMITDYEGRLRAACPKAGVEATMMTMIDIGACRHYRRSMPTHNGLNSFKKIYNYFEKKITYPPHPQIAEDPEWDMYKSRGVMREAMDAFWADYYKNAEMP